MQRLMRIIFMNLPFKILYADPLTGGPQSLTIFVTSFPIGSVKANVFAGIYLNKILIFGAFKRS